MSELDLSRARMWGESRDESRESSVVCRGRFLAIAVIIVINIISICLIISMVIINSIIMLIIMIFKHETVVCRGSSVTNSSDGLIFVKRRALF